MIGYTLYPKLVPWAHVFILKLLYYIKCRETKEELHIMIIYKQNIENGIPMYEIITKTFKTITVKFDETFNKNEIYKLLSLLENDLDNMKLSY